MYQLVEWPSPRNQDARRRTLFALARASHDGKRLAALRRGLGALLVATGAPAIGLGCVQGSSLGWRFGALALLWLAMLLPMARVLWMESRNARLAEGLRVLAVMDDDDDGPPRRG